MNDLHDLYQEQLLEEYAHPHCWGLLEKPSCSARYGNASCGDTITVSLLVDESDVITAVGWEGEGCAVSMAGMSVLAQAIQGQSVTVVAKWQYQQVQKLLGLEQISPSRIACLQMGLLSVQQAIIQYQSNTSR